MKTKHTDGKWDVDKEIPTRVLCNNGTIHIDVRYYDHKAEEAEANAKLIAAAPELLENLIRCVDRLEENDMGDMSAVRRAKEAIKKATV